MLAFVDESGCTGMKLDKGSSPTFTVSAILFQDRGVAERCYSRIDNLRRELGVTKEFHFNKCSHDNRMRFFETVSDYDFQYMTVIFDKRKIITKELTFSEPLMRYPVFALFAGLATKMASATVVIDRTGSSDFRKSLAKDLKKEINARCSREVIKKVKDADSHRHSLLQLADMACGAVSRSYCGNKKNQNTYRQAILQHEICCTVWPCA